MIDKKWINQAKKENRLPINQQAIKFLKEAKEPVDDYHLAALSFLLWAQEAGLIRPVDLLQDWVDGLLSWTPREVSKFLELKQAPVVAKNPEELADQLLNLLDLALSEKVEGYPPLPTGSYR
jgi:hypothetical protein